MSSSAFKAAQCTASVFDTLVCQRVWFSTLRGAIDSDGHQVKNGWSQLLYLQVDTKKKKKERKNSVVLISPHHCSIIKSNTRLTFRSESRLKSDSTKGAVGGVSGRRPEVRVSSQSAASNSDGALRLRDFPLCERGEVQMGGGGGGGGAGTTWLGFTTAGDGGSSSKREEQSGEGVKLSSLVGCWEDFEGSAPEGGGGGGDEDEESGRDSAGGLSSARWVEPKRQVTKMFNY